jgi:hypothetical protein
MLSFERRRMDELEAMLHTPDAFVKRLPFNETTRMNSSKHSHSQPSEAAA